MRHMRVRQVGLFTLLIIGVSVWVVALALLWILTTLYLEVLGAVIELAQLS